LDNVGADILRCNARVEDALDLQAVGLRVFPLHHPTREGCSCGNPKCSSAAKHPLTRNGFRDATLDGDQVQKWWTRWPNANIGVATGRGLVVLDLDSDDAIRQAASNGLPCTVEVRTGKGLHVYFQGEARTRTGFSPGMDLRGTGGYVVAPPSVHASGTVYEWIRSFDDADLAPMPEWLIQASRRTRPRPVEALADDAATFGEGERNSQLFRHGCALAREGLPAEELAEALATINAERCRPPLDADEVERIAANAARYASDSAFARKIEDKALLEMGLGPFATTVYVALRTFTNRESQCWPAYETLAERAGAGRSATITAVKSLEEVGLVRIERRAYPLSNLYTLVDPIQVTGGEAEAAPDKTAAGRWQAVMGAEDLPEANG
jgi:hypothetical protein